MELQKEEICFTFICVWFVGFISLMIFSCTCSQKMSASKRWIFKMKEGLKNKRITKKWIKRITDICSPQNTKGVGDLGSANISSRHTICRLKSLYYFLPMPHFKKYLFILLRFTSTLKMIFLIHNRNYFKLIEKTFYYIHFEHPYQMFGLMNADDELLQLYWAYLRQLHIRYWN